MTHWPLRDLVLRTPRLELRPDDDTGLDGLVEVAYEGVHPPTEMPFMVRHSGRVVGTQSLTGTDFVVTREVRTGSRLGMAHQGAGLGTEMRTAVLLLAFDHLGARAARSDAFADNHASLRVSAMLGYRTDGTETVVRRGERTDDVRLVVDADGFVRPGWTLRGDGLDACRGLLPNEAQASPRRRGSWAARSPVA